MDEKEMKNNFNLEKNYTYELVIRVKDQENKFVQFIKLKTIGFSKAVFLQKLK